MPAKGWQMSDYLVPILCVQQLIIFKLAHFPVENKKIKHLMDVLNNLGFYRLIFQFSIYFSLISQIIIVINTNAIWSILLCFCVNLSMKMLTYTQRERWEERVRVRRRKRPYNINCLKVLPLCNHELRISFVLWDEMVSHIPII